MSFDSIQTLGTGDGGDDAAESTDETDDGTGSLRRLILAAAGLGAAVLVRRWRSGTGADGRGDTRAHDGADVSAADDVPSEDDGGGGSLDAADVTTGAADGGRGIGRKLGGMVASAVLALLVRKAIRRRGDGSAN